MDVLKVANWFRARNLADMHENDNADELTQLKLMKLLYFAQGVNLAAYDKPLFDDDIRAWAYGPVVEKVHRKYSGDRGIVNKAIPVTEADWADYKVVESNPDASSVLNAVYDAYGSMSTTDLVNLTHSQSPWKETPQSEVISQSLIKDYFKSQVVEH